MTTGTARRATVAEARKHFHAGGDVLVSARGHLEEMPVSRDTTTHNSQRITWSELVEMVATWRNRYPNQRFFVVESL